MLCFGAATSWFPVQSRFGFRSRSDCGARLKRANSASVKKSRRNWISTANSGQQSDSASRAESTRAPGVDRPQSGRRFGRRPQGRWASIIGRPIGEADFAPFNAAMIAYGCSLTATQYSASIDAMRKAGQSIVRELDRFDAFVTPTLTQPPRPIGYWSMEDGDRVRYLARGSDAALMFAFNISGPSDHLDSGRTDQRERSIGVQIVGRHGDEATVLQLARQIEQAAPWAPRRPAICASQGGPDVQFRQ